MIPVLYQDERCVLILKPAGIAVHTSEHARERRPLLQRLRDQLGLWLYPVHRLDRPTSGLMLFALDSEAARLLAKDFQEGRIQKTYEAVIRGWTELEWREERPLRHPDSGALLPATTYFKTLEQVELNVPTVRFPTLRLSRIEAAPHTGRFHQIRRHLAGASHPILGDTAHGDHQLNRWYRSAISTRLLLCATGLQWTPPGQSEVRQDWNAPPSRMMDILKGLGFSGVREQEGPTNNEVDLPESPSHEPRSAHGLLKSNVLCSPSWQSASPDARPVLP